jgi:hypothetical protein
MPSEEAGELRRQEGRNGWRRRGRHKAACSCERCCARRISRNLARQAGKEPEQVRAWDKRLTLEAIASYSNDTIAELFWIGRTMELAKGKKHEPTEAATDAPLTEEHHTDET